MLCPVSKLLGFFHDIVTSANAPLLPIKRTHIFITSSLIITNIGVPCLDNWSVCKSHSSFISQLVYMYVLPLIYLKYMQLPSATSSLVAFSQYICSMLTILHKTALINMENMEILYKVMFNRWCNNYAAMTQLLTPLTFF